MRIGINTLYLVPGDVGGTEIYLMENLNCMVGAYPEDTFIFFTTQDNDALFRSRFSRFVHTEFVELPFQAAKRPLRIIMEQTLLPWKVWRQKCEVLWSPGYTAPFFSSARQVVTIHDMQYKVHPEDLTFLERITLDFLVQGACKRCDRIIAVSRFSKEAIATHTKARPDQIDVVYEGVDPSFAQPQPFPQSILPFPDDVPYILCVAHTYPHKQVHLLIEAFTLVQSEIPHHLVLVGKERRGEAEVQEALDACPDRGRVHRVTNLEYQTLQSLYRHADLFVLPSKYEGFGLPVLEAMLAGVPVLTTRFGSIPEVGGDCVGYFEKNTSASLADKLRTMIGEEHPDFSDQVQAAKQRAQTFTWEISAENTYAVLRKTKAHF